MYATESEFYEAAGSGVNGGLVFNVGKGMGGGGTIGKGVVKL